MLIGVTLVSGTLAYSNFPVKFKPAHVTGTDVFTPDGAPFSELIGCVEGIDSEGEDGVDAAG